MKSKDHPLTEQFLYNLKEHKSDISNVYLGLFSLLTKDELEYTLNYLNDLKNGDDPYFKEYGKENWFQLFHKSVRQTDFFSDCFQKRKYSLLTDDEEKELRFLRNKVREKDYNKRGEDQTFNDEYKYYLDLSSKKNRESMDVDISGTLDGILWSTIHVDEKNVLIVVFKTTFGLQFSFV